MVGLKENVIIGGLIPAGTGVLFEDEFECEHRPEDENIYQEINEQIEQDKSLEDEEDLDDEFVTDEYLDELDASLDEVEEIE